MKGKILSGIIILLMTLGSYGAVGTQLEIEYNYTNPEEFIPGEVVVAFHTNLDNLDPIYVTDIDNFEGQNIKEKIEVLNVAVVEVSEGEELAFINSVINSPYVKYAEPNFIIHLWYTPNDPKWDEQWGPKRINCEEAWDTTQGSNDVKIAIVDTGIDYNHEDLSPNYVSGGYDHVNEDNDPMDDQGHGSHCAGIAAARINNDVGIAGVAGKCKIMAEKVLDSGGSGSSTDVANGITHAADNGANVISLSLGGSSAEVMKDACDYAYNNKGVVVVAASGNDYSSSVSYPAKYSSVIAVGATDQNDNRCSFSNYGQELELMAPGKSILSANMGGGYVLKTGTSMACPHVAGVAALVKSKYPSMTNTEIRQVLKDTAKDLGDPGWDQYYGYGLVDAAEAVGGSGPLLPMVTITIHKITNDPSLGDFEPIDSWIWPNNEVPEWYYRVGVKSGSEQQYQHNSNKDINGWWIFDWIGEYTWDVQQAHLFGVSTSTVDISIKLMDHDAIWEGGSDDLADISAAPGTGENNELPNKLGAMYNGIYDLITNELTGDYVTNDESYKLTEGEFGDDPANNANVWFKITDDYIPDDYEPDLDVDPKSISCGEVGQGETVKKTFKVINKADKDPMGWADDLEWSVKSKPDFIKSISPTSGALNGGQSEEVTITIDTSEKGDYSGNIVIQSNGGQEEIRVTVSVSRVKSRFLSVFDILQNLQARLPVLGKLFSFFFFFHNNN